MTPPFSRITNSVIPESCTVVGWVNIYNTSLGEEVFVSPFVEIGGAVIGSRTRIGSHTYICPGVKIGSDCFVAHGVMFCNDDFKTPEWYLHISELREKWVARATIVGDCVRIGSGAVIMPVTIGSGAVIGAGAVVVKDVPSGAVVRGSPAREAVAASRIRC